MNNVGGKITKRLIRAMAASTGQHPPVSKATSSESGSTLIDKQQIIVRDQIAKEIEKVNIFGFDIREINELLAWSLSQYPVVPVTIEDYNKINRMHAMLHDSSSNLLFYCLYPEKISNDIQPQNLIEAKNIVKQVIEAEIESNLSALRLLNVDVDANIAPPSSASSSTSAIYSALGSEPSTSHVSSVSNNNNIETPTGDVEDDVLAIEEANNRRNEQTSAPRSPRSN